MKRTTISLPDLIAAMLEREARRQGLSMSEVARRALMAHYGPDSLEPRKLPFANLGQSGEHYTARNAEEILAREWNRDRDR